MNRLKAFVSNKQRSIFGSQIPETVAESHVTILKAIDIDSEEALVQSQRVINRVATEADIEAVELEETKEKQRQRQSHKSGGNTESTDGVGDDNVIEEQAAEEQDEQSKKVNKLIKKYCVRVAVATTMANSAVAIPGVVLFGNAVSAGLVTKLQSDLITAIGKTYEVDLQEDTKKDVHEVIKGGSEVGKTVGNVAVKQAASTVSKLSKKVAAKSTSKYSRAVPVVGPLAFATIGMTTTYIIGKRAKNYFAAYKQRQVDLQARKDAGETVDEEAEMEIPLESWSDSVKQLTGVDENMLQDYLKTALATASKNMKAAASSVLKYARKAKDRVFRKKEQDETEIEEAEDPAEDPAEASGVKSKSKNKGGDAEIPAMKHI